LVEKAEYHVTSSEAFLEIGLRSTSLFFWDLLFEVISVPRQTLSSANGSKVISSVSISGGSGPGVKECLEEELVACGKLNDCFDSRALRQQLKVAVSEGSLLVLSRSILRSSAAISSVVTISETEDSFGVIFSTKVEGLILCVDSLVEEELWLDPGTAVVILCKEEFSGILEIFASSTFWCRTVCISSFFVGHHS